MGASLAPVLQEFIMKKLLFALIFFSLPSLFLLPTVYSKTPTAEDLIYITETFYPFNYRENGIVTGFAVELLELIWEELGTAPQEIRVYPWPRGYRWLQSRPNVVLFSTGRTEMREKQFQWVCPIGKQIKIIFLAKKSRNLTINNLDDAKKYRIGTIREDVSEQTILRKGFKMSQLEPMLDMRSNLRKLLHGRIDLITYDENALFALIDHNNMDRNQFETVFLINQTGLCYAFNRRVPPSLVERFQQALNNITETKAYNTLWIKYGMDR